MRITEKHIRFVFQTEPTLTYSGFATKPEDIEKGQNALLNHLAEVQTCFDWIILQRIGRRVSDTDHSSYVLKHAVEQSAGYVSNGAFLAATVIAGIPYRRIPKSLNALVAIRGTRRKPGYEKFVPLQPEASAA